MAKKVGKRAAKKEGKRSASEVSRKTLYSYFRELDTSRQADGDHSKLLIEFRSLGLGKEEKRKRLKEVAIQILDHFRIERERDYTLPEDHPLYDPWGPRIDITETLANLLSYYLGEEELAIDDEGFLLDWPYSL